jgi:hypothetical protein
LHDPVLDDHLKDFLHHALDGLVNELPRELADEMANHLPNELAKDMLSELKNQRLDEFAKEILAEQLNERLALLDELPELLDEMTEFLNDMPNEMLSEKTVLLNEMPNELHALDADQNKSLMLLDRDGDVNNRTNKITDGPYHRQHQPSNPPDQELNQMNRDHLNAFDRGQN